MVALCNGLQTKSADGAGVGQGKETTKSGKKGSLIFIISLTLQKSS